MGSTPPPERSESFQPGQTVGKFYLVQVLGEGGTSRIFKALQQPISRVVALKIPSFAGSAGVLSPDEFLSEATLMARLDHPNIVRIHDFGVEDGKAFICMEYVEGKSLLEQVSETGPLPVAAVLAVGLQVLEALRHAHGRDVLHQDLSPANVLLSRQGRAKLTDFGMAGKRASGKEGNVVGTPAFLSPEQVAGKPASARSDLFSFGSLLYFAARGEPLFDPGPENVRLREAFLAIEKARWQPPLDRLRALPASLSRIIRSSLEGGDPESILHDLRDLWAQAEGQASPEEALRRELTTPPADAAEDAASEGEIRARYLRLRSEGRHREAVGLLERALRRQPDNPVLRDLLATPPARAKSAPVTVEVAHAGGRPAGRARRTAAWAAAAALPLFVLAAWVTRGPDSPPGGAAAKSAAPKTSAAAEGRASAGADDAHPAAGLPPATYPPLSASSAPSTSSASSAPFRDPGSGSPRLTRVSAAGPAGRNRPVSLEAAEASAASAPAIRSKARRAPRPPGLSLGGPAGTRVLVNDTLVLTSPAPRGGWSLPAGLVDLVVSFPGKATSISSSLFLAADTLYTLDFEDGGGFSVSRRAR